MTRMAVRLLTGQNCPLQHPQETGSALGEDAVSTGIILFVGRKTQNRKEGVPARRRR